MIFVFGSNLAGRHNGGAAREAEEHFGAERGVGIGPTGRAYALPTMDAEFKPLAKEEIQSHVDVFLEYARHCSHQEFFVTAIGCGIAGFTPEQIAPMFAGSPDNCTLHRRLVDALHAAEVGEVA